MPLWVLGSLTSSPEEQRDWKFPSWSLWVLNANRMLRTLLFSCIYTSVCIYR